MDIALSSQPVEANHLDSALLDLLPELEAVTKPSRGFVRLSAEEEAELAIAWRQHGDQSARDRLITGNLGLVVAIARRYRGSSVPMDDLIAEGNLGLLHAVDGFDPTCGARLSTYAAYWIRQGISRAFASHSPRGRLSRKDRQDLGEYDRACREHYTKQGELPTDSQVAKALGWSGERVANCRSLTISQSRPASLDHPLPMSNSPQTTAVSDGGVGKEQGGMESDRLEAVLGELDNDERFAVELRFGLHGHQPQTIESIARSLGNTKRETKAAIRGAMTKLGRSLRPATRTGRSLSAEASL